MADVLKIALERRAELNEEVAKLDDFIRMAEMLIRNSQSAAMPAGGVEQPSRPAQQPPMQQTVDLGTVTAPEVTRPSIIRRSAAG